MSLPTFETSPAVAAGDLQNSPTPSTPSTPSDLTPPSRYPLIQLYPDLPDPDAMDVDQSPPETPSQEHVGLLGLQALGERHNK